VNAPMPRPAIVDVPRGRPQPEGQRQPVSRCRRDIGRLMEAISPPNVGSLSAGEKQGFLQRLYTPAGQRRHSMKSPGKISL